MPSYEYTLEAWDVGSLVGTLHALMRTATNGRTAVDYHIDVGTTSGYRSVTFGYTIPGEFGADFAFTVLFLGCAADAKISAREVVGSAGVLAPTMLMGWPPSDPLSGFGSALGFWGEFIVAVVVQILNDWTPAIAESLTVLSYEPIDGVCGTAAVPVSVQTDGEVMILPLQMFYSRQTEPDRVGLPSVTAAPAASSAGSSVVVVGSPMSEVVQALRDIALRSTVTSINDRTAIVELGTNDILIPGGG